MSQVLGQLKEVEPLEALRTDIQAITELALSQRVMDVTTKDAALAIAVDVKRVRKAIEERRKLITAPLQDTVKRVIAFADTLDQPLARAEAHIRGEAVRYANEIAAEQRKAQAAIEMEKLRIRREEEARLRSAAAMAESTEEHLQKADQIREETKVQQVETSVRAREVKAQGVKGTTEVWKFEVTDPAQVPRQYLAVDQSAIRAAIQYQKLREIPGVRIYSETQVRLG